MDANNTNKSNEKIPKVTVILPSLNVVQYIDQCIESVRSQTLQEIEIICVDAGSSDGTKEIIQKHSHSDSRIRVIQSPQKSYGYQVNLGIKVARGDYIGIIETDDFAETKMLEKMYSVAVAVKADVVKSNYYECRGERDSFFELYAGLPYERVIQPKAYPSLLIRKPAIWTGLYKKSFIKENNISFLETAGASYQDASFIMKVWIASERVCLLRGAFLHYRVDNPNSSVKSLEKVFCVRDEMLTVHQFLEEKPEKKKEFEKIVWDREALAYEWNLNRLSNELKYPFLLGVQKRFQIGIKREIYDRSHLQWSTWRMILEVAEDPLIYLGKMYQLDNHEQATDGKIEKRNFEVEIKKWKRKERLMALPQIVYDIINLSRQYGLSYCIQYVLRKSSKNI